MDCSMPGFPGILSSLSPRVCSNSCPLSQWWHPNHLILYCPLLPLSFCLQSFPASGSFPVSQHFAPSGQSIGATASASILPMNIQDWFPLGLTGFTSFRMDWLDLLAVPRDSQESSQAPQFKRINSLVLSLLYDSNFTSIHDYWKNHCFNYMHLCLQSDVSAF